MWELCSDKSQAEPPVLRSAVFVDAEFSLFHGEPFGLELHLQHNVQPGLQYRLREFLSHHLINHECKSHSLLPGEQHGGVCDRYGRVCSAHCPREVCVRVCGGGGDRVI